MSTKADKKSAASKSKATKEDVAVVEAEHVEAGAKGHRRASSSAAAGVLSASEIPADGILKVHPEAEKLNWKINTAASSLDNPDALKKVLTTPPLKSVEIKFPNGISFVARNMKTGVTVKDALDVVYKQFKKRQDDEITEPYLQGFYFDEDDDKGTNILHAALSKDAGPMQKKSKKKSADTE